jgi:hypothetical protein
LPANVNRYPEDTSHGALSMRYIESLQRDLDCLDTPSASLGELMPLDDSHLVTAG